MQATDNRTDLRSTNPFDGLTPAETSPQTRSSLRNFATVNTNHARIRSIEPQLAPRRRDEDGTDSAAIIPITIHPNHPIHRDQALVAQVLRGDQTACQQLEARIKPYIENFASDPSWDDYATAYQRGIDRVSQNNYQSLRDWNPTVRSLNQYIDYLLRRELTAEMATRRHHIRQSRALSQAIKASINDLSDTHYWVLTKILIDGVRPKRLIALVDQCPEVKLRSVGSIGSTYSRAIRRLLAVCPVEFRATVAELLRTRQRSGRYR